jgi:hypothetical protein
MKKIIYSLIVCLTVIGLYSCEDETSQDTSRITYYATLNITDGDIYWPAGTAFVDPGYSAEMNGEDVTDQIVVIGDVDTNTPGLYNINYQITNEDGYSKAATRSVYVYDTNGVTGLEGTYTGNVDRTASDGSVKSYAGNPVTLSTTEYPGVYEISDWIAGFYDIGYDYGSDYQFPGLIGIAADNSIYELSMSNPWGDPFSSCVGNYDPSTGSITYTAGWLSYEFAVELTK